MEALFSQGASWTRQEAMCTSGTGTGLFDIRKKFFTVRSVTGTITPGT